MTERSKALRAGNPVVATASRANAAAASAARWPDGPGPITHGTSNAMTARCREAGAGTACATCLEGSARRMREWKQRRRERS